MDLLAMRRWPDRHGGSHCAQRPRLASLDVRRDLQQRQQHEGALVQARVRHGQRRRSRRWSPIQQQVEVERARRVAVRPLAAVRQFDRLQRAPAERRRRQCGVEFDDRVDVVRPRRRRPARCGRGRAWRDQRAPGNARAARRRRPRTLARASPRLAPRPTKARHPPCDRVQAPRRRLAALRRRRLRRPARLARGSAAPGARRLAGCAPPRRLGRQRALVRCGFARGSLQQRLALVGVPSEKSSHQSASSMSTSPASAAQPQEVVAGAKARLLDQRVRRVAVRRSKRGCISQISRMSAASLPRPEMSPMRASNTASTACCSAGIRRLAARAQRCPAFAAPRATAGRRAGSSAPRAAPSLDARGRCRPAPASTKLLAPSWRCAVVEHHVEHREHAAVQALLAQLLEAGQRVAGLQQLDHLVEQARGRHVGRAARAISAIGARVAGSIAKPSLAAKRTTRTMRTGSSR